MESPEETAEREASIRGFSALGFARLFFDKLLLAACHLLIVPHDKQRSEKFVQSSTLHLLWAPTKGSSGGGTALLLISVQTLGLPVAVPLHPIGCIFLH